MNRINLPEKGNGHIVDIDPSFNPQIIKDLPNVHADKPPITPSHDPDIQTDLSISDEYLAYFIKSFWVQRAIKSMHVPPENVILSSGISIPDEFNEYFKIYFLEQSTARSSYIPTVDIMVKPKILPRIIRGVSLLFIGCAIALIIYNVDAFLAIPNFLIAGMLSCLITIWVTYLEPFRHN